VEEERRNREEKTNPWEIQIRGKWLGVQFGKEENVCLYLGKCDYVSIGWRRKRIAKKNTLPFWSENLVLFCLEGRPTSPGRKICPHFVY
jgi:hypothetical protein